MRNYGDTPNVALGAFSSWREIFYSEPERALTRQIQLAPGYGTLPAGTVLAVNLSAAGNVGLHVPYNPTTFTGVEDHPGRAYLVASPAAAQAAVHVTIADSYKFAVGDDLIINDDTSTAENLGAIVSIDRTTYTNFAVITATTNLSGSFTTARFAYACVEAGDSSNNYSDAVGILMQDIETGTGSKAAGALAPMILSNALLYEGALNLLDSAAKTDLSVASSGIYLLMK